MTDSEPDEEAVRRETLGDVAARLLEQTGNAPFTIDLDPQVDPAAELDLIRDQMEGISQALLQPITEALEASVRNLTLPGFQSLLLALDRFAPQNWPRGRPLEVSALVRESGLPLVWVPGPVVIEALLDAHTSQRDDLLLSHSPEILVGIGTALDAVEDPDLMGLASGAREAAQAYGHGLPMASQALSAALFTTLVHRMGHRKLEEAKEFFESYSSDPPPLRMFGFGLLAHCGARALSHYFPGKGDPIPHSFNRHASTHSFDPTQFTPANALAGLMLVTGLLREIQELRVTDPQG